MKTSTFILFLSVIWNVFRGHFELVNQEKEAMSPITNRISLSPLFEAFATLFKIKCDFSFSVILMGVSLFWHCMLHNFQINANYKWVISFQRARAGWMQHLFGWHNYANCLVFLWALTFDLFDTWHFSATPSRCSVKLQSKAYKWYIVSIANQDVYYVNIIKCYC